MGEVGEGCERSFNAEGGMGMPPGSVTAAEQHGRQPAVTVKNAGRSAEDGYRDARWVGGFVQSRGTQGALK